MGMAAAQSQFHVLAVDDSIIDRKLIEMLFKTSSCHVTTVDSGSKALEFLGLNEHVENSLDHHSVPSNHHQEVGVNLVITDYCMPGMTGYDLLKKIKESSSLKNIPVVIMSSENVPSRINRCLEEGAEEFFLKPVRLSDVNKLRPHMMKTKSKNPEKDAEDNQEPTPEQPILQQECTIEDVKLQVPLQAQSQSHTEQKQSEQPTQMPSNNNENKRKAVEESLSPERTRPRYNGLTAVSNL